MDDSREIQAIVHLRLHANSDGREPTHNSGACHSFPAATVVWETLKVLKDKELIELDPLTLDKRTARVEGSRP